MNNDLSNRYRKEQFKDKLSGKVKFDRKTYADPDQQKLF